MTSPEAAQGWLDTAKTAENGTPDAMFVIHRSTNDNMVVYKGAVEESGYAGCYPYWIMSVPPPCRPPPLPISLPSTDPPPLTPHPHPTPPPAPPPPTASATAHTRATKGGAREELTMIERNTAYGIKSEASGENTWTIKIASLSDREITVTNTDGVWKASCNIGGTTGPLIAVHVEMKSSWGMPKVDYVELFGEGGLYEKKQN